MEKGLKLKKQAFDTKFSLGTLEAADKLQGGRVSATSVIGEGKTQKDELTGFVFGEINCRVAGLGSGCNI